VASIWFYQEGEHGFRLAEVKGRHCLVTIEPRPGHCDRGNFIAKVFVNPGDTLKLWVDDQDGWPRYYFDLGRAKAEVEAWMRKRGDWIELQRDDDDMLKGVEDAGFDSTHLRKTLQERRLTESTRRKDGVNDPPTTTPGTR
jgi:hypothetical protein